MPFQLDTFKGALSSQGARPTLFEATINYSGFDASALYDFTFHCKAAQLPGKTLGIIEIPYFGRKIKVAGDQTFAEWTVTVINEENFDVRNNFEKWMSVINTHVGNRLADRSYKQTNAEVFQYNKIGGAPSKKYKFNSIWPSDISAIDVSWESNDAIEEFTVTLQYDWWESDPNNNY